MIKTMIYQEKDLENQDVLDHIHHVISNDGLVVFPTETVYGIGANALNPKAAQKIYGVKGRPSDNPLIVHIAHIDWLPDLVTHISSHAKKCIQAFWPGPLTLVFQKQDIIPYEITGGLETVGIRYPSHQLALKTIGAAKKPLGAPSANISGRPSSTIFEHVFNDLMGKVDIIIDGGKSTIGLESTVLDVTSEIPTIFRPGFVSKQMIESVLGISILDVSETQLTDVPKSPGMKYTHYAPKGKITVIEGNQTDVIAYINKTVEQLKDIKTAVICATEYVKTIHCQHVIDLGSVLDPDEIASNLFIALRQMDDLAIDHIFTHTFSKDHIGSAIMNRLLKASGYNIITL